MSTFGFQNEAFLYPTSAPTSTQNSDREQINFRAAAWGGTRRVGGSVGAPRRGDGGWRWGIVGAISFQVSLNSAETNTHLGFHN